MKKITTKDGSITFYSKQYDDIYHSRSGAVEEAVEKFVKPARIAELSKTGCVNILDICFGLGYNSCAAIDTILYVNPDCEINIICLENDQEILRKIQGLTPPMRNYGIIEELVKNNEYDKKNIHIKLIIGDARETIKEINEEFDAVFLDPFSPSKQPDLWQAEFFKDII